MSQNSLMHGLIALFIALFSSETTFAAQSHPVEILAKAYTLEFTAEAPIWGDTKWAHYAVGKIPYSDYVADWKARNPTHPYFDDIYSLPGSSRDHINWLAVNGQNVGKLSTTVPTPLYAWFGGRSFFASFVKAYLEERDPIYADRWFDLVQNFLETILIQSKNLSKSEQAAASLYFVDGNENKGLARPSVLAFSFFLNSVYQQLAEIVKIKGAKSDDAALSIIQGQFLIPTSDEIAWINSNDRLVRLVTTIRDIYFQTIFDSYTIYGKTYIPNQRYAGLVTLATYIYTFNDGSPEWMKWKIKIDDALLSLFPQTFAPDGMFLEHSLGYGDGNVSYLKTLISVAKSQNPPWIKAAQSIIDHFNIFKAAIASPWGGAPELANDFWFPVNSLSAEQKALQFQQSSLVLPFSGYSVLRSGWDPDAAYLFFDQGGPKNGHSLAGVNSIQLANGGKQILVSGGSANYTPVSPERDAYLNEKSSWKANTILVDGFSQVARDAPSVLEKPLPLRYLSTADYDYTEGLWDGEYQDALNPDQPHIKDVRHSRRIIFDRKHRVYFVIDMINADQPHHYTQVWKFAPTNLSFNPAKPESRIYGFTDAEISTSADENRIITNATYKGAQNIDIRIFGAPMSFTMYNGRDGEAYGFYNSYFGTYNAAASTRSVDVHAEFGKISQNAIVNISVLSPFADATGRPWISVTDLTQDASTGVRIEFADHHQTTLMASSRIRDLQIGEHRFKADLVLQANDENKKLLATLVIADPHQPRASYLETTDQKFSITAPSIMSWTGEGTSTSPYAEWLHQP